MYVIPQPNSREYVLVLKSIKISRDDQYVCNITTKFSPMWYKRKENRLKPPCFHLQNSALYIGLCTRFTSTNTSITNIDSKVPFSSSPVFPSQFRLLQRQARALLCRLLLSRTRFGTRSISTLCLSLSSSFPPFVSFLSASFLLLT